MVWNDLIINFVRHAGAFTFELMTKRFFVHHIVLTLCDIQFFYTHNMVDFNNQVFFFLLRSHMTSLSPRPHR